MIEKIIKLLEEKNYIVEDVTIYFRDENNKEKYITIKIIQILICRKPNHCLVFLSKSSIFIWGIIIPAKKAK